MKKCILLSMDNLDDFECYDSLLIEPMKQLGWQTSEVSWKNECTNWNDYDAVVIRSTWDYQDYCSEFLNVLEAINKSNALLMNTLDLIKWNINKNYLQELDNKEVKIIPTVWNTYYSAELLLEALTLFDTNKLIIKPCVSANADDTFILTKNLSHKNHQQALQIFNGREFMLQPFMKNIVSEGEFSLFYFNGELIHPIIKKPKQDDFRVQEEHGGQLSRVEPEQALLKAGNKALKALPSVTLYARLDFVRHNDEFVMMEAELIEPSLYFNLDKNSPERFAKAFIEYYEKNSTVN